MKPSPVCALLAVVVAAFTTVPSLTAAPLVTNGDFELWGSVSGTPPQGSPTGWMGANTVIQSTGLVAGSTYSAVIQAGQSGLYPQLLSNPTQFEISFVLAATDPGSSSARSFNLQLQREAAVGFLNLRTVQGSSGAGFITLQAFDQTLGWTNLAQNLNASVYVGGTTNTFTTLNPYNISLNMDLTGTPSYSLTYGAVGGAQTTLSGLTYFQSSPAGGTLQALGFSGALAATNYGIDNFTAVSVPEPQALFLLLLGGLGILMIRRHSLRTNLPGSGV